MKNFFKKIITTLLWHQVKRLREKNNFKLIGIVGSIGKTSTKIAISRVLSLQKRVMFDEGNYNDIVSIPLVFFGHKMPHLYNIFGWLFLMLKNELKIIQNYDYDFVVIEIGTDAPGQINLLKKYIRLDVVVITAVTEEHMEFFKNIDEVAKEEWSASFWSELVFANCDLCKLIPNDVDKQKIIFYGKDSNSHYKIENILNEDLRFTFDISHNGKKIGNLDLSCVSQTTIYSVSIAFILASRYGLDLGVVKDEVRRFKAFKGRMQLLEGINDSVIIDDSYNASPLSVKIALDTLYNLPKKQKIAILGSMNELGDISEKLHREIGKYCDPGMVDYLITIGEEANKYIAGEAVDKGCRVYKSKNAIDAGNFVKDIIKEDCAILVKGSQNGVFAEESIKPILKNKYDKNLLVRQGGNWINKKSKFFGSRV